MKQTAIFLPVAALAIWTLIILVMLPFRRFRAAAQRKVTADDFRFGESANVPGEVTLPNRAWMNLLEAPVLFYVACFVWFSLGAVTELVVGMAWAYVALRVVHTLIHITYNKVLHRLMAFALSNVVLATLWIQLLTVLLPLAA